MSVRPLQSLLQSSLGPALPLTPLLARLYGAFHLRQPRNRPYVFSNFVSTLDGIVSLGVRGHRGGGDISGFATQDRFVMGLLRAVADVVIVGAGALDADPGHIWTARAVCPRFADDYQELERELRKSGTTPLNVIVSGRGTVDLKLPVFASGQVQTVVLTTRPGARRLSRQRVPSSTNIVALPSTTEHLSATAVLRAVTQLRAGRRFLIEGGPQLLGGFYKARLIDEQFLTLAPQLSGRQLGDKRLSLVMGQVFAPRDALWGTLIDARVASQLLFLRYAFSRGRRKAGRL